jgi:hypothetical protein
MLKNYCCFHSASWQEIAMRGDDEQQLDVFSYVSPEQRIPQDHPLRPVHVMADEALRELEASLHQVRKIAGRTNGRPGGLAKKAFRAAAPSR